MSTSPPLSPPAPAAGAGVIQHGQQRRRVHHQHHRVRVGQPQPARPGSPPRAAPRTPPAPRRTPPADRHRPRLAPALPVQARAGHSPRRGCCRPAAATTPRRCGPAAGSAGTPGLPAAVAASPAGSRRSPRRAVPAPALQHRDRVGLLPADPSTATQPAARSPSWRASRVLPDPPGPGHQPHPRRPPATHHPATGPARPRPEPDHLRLRPQIPGRTVSVGEPATALPSVGGSGAGANAFSAAWRLSAATAFRSRRSRVNSHTTAGSSPASRRCQYPSYSARMHPSLETEHHREHHAEHGKCDSP